MGEAHHPFGFRTPLAQQQQRRTAGKHDQAVTQRTVRVIIAVFHEERRALNGT